ncbi:hypothetical protein EDB85DRAFT_1899169 [Lactarius pseudohatsudake]|nr:hypothetical protein EDB85DRAFT_1899169 [Lactarius pseudohatsudake]
MPYSSQIIPFIAQSLITSCGDSKSPSPDEPSTSRQGTQHKSSIHSIDHKVKQLDLTALVKSDAKRKARNSDDEGDKEGEKDTRWRPTLKQQRGCGPSRAFGSKCLPLAQPPHILLGTDTDRTEDSQEVLISMMFATTHHRAPTDPVLDHLPFHSHLPFGPLPTAAFMGNLDAPSRLPRWECSLPPSSLLYDVHNLQVVQALPAESQVVIEFPEIVATAELLAGPRTVVEVGCGAGNTIFLLLEQNHNPELHIH